ncbi:MAG: hypothetical protein WBD07_13945 [Vicinamibacterales bacterium]
MKTVFLRVLDADDKAAALLAAISEPEAARGKQRFDVDPASFASVPRSPLAYWVSSRLRRLFKEFPAVEGDRRTAKIGPSTGDDPRYVRCWWEVRVLSKDSGPEWPAFAKGGVHSPFYADVHLVIHWDPRRKTFRGFIGRPGRETERPNSLDFFFRPGLTWPLRTQIGLALRAMPAGCIFGHKGPCIFVATNDSQELLALLAIANATSFRSLVDLQMAFGAFEVGVIQRTPVPPLNVADRDRLADLGRRAWSLKRSLDERTETSHAFTLPAPLQVEGETLALRAVAWADRIRSVQLELATIQNEIDNRCFRLYGLDDADRRAIAESLDSTSGDGDKEAAADMDIDAEDEVDEWENTSADPLSLAAELVSWAVGVAFGRFDVRLAIADRAPKAEPEPFDPLLVCSPAMLTGADGLPLASATAGYPHAFPENGILVDDPGHPRDLTAAVRAVFDTVFGNSADEWWNEVASLLDAKDHDLRAWLASGFFEHHLKRHSKSRRKAPILWQLGTSSGCYSAWLYVHRLTRDSFFQLQNDVVAPKLAHEERQLTSLVRSTGDSPSAKERKEIAAQAAFVEELRALLDEVKRVTPLWNPTLDDGVVLTMAPLWRLAPQHKPWQKELKGKWDELVDSDYDWAQSAMHLWPERVVPQCATDRSLAIAHGLEDVFWAEGADGKMKPRSTPTRPLDDLVRERTSAAVKAALKSLLEAPVTAARGGRGRVRRAVTADAHKGTP